MKYPQDQLTKIYKRTGYVSSYLSIMTENVLALIVIDMQNCFVSKGGIDVLTKIHNFLPKSR